MEEVRLEFQTDSCPSLPKLFGVLLQSRECVFSAIILSLTRGTFWIYFRDYYNRILSSKTKTNKEKRNESINCSKIFEILIRFKSVLRLGIKLLGVQEFGDFFHVILSAQVAHLNEIQTDPTSSPCKFRNTVFCILLLPFHIIRTLVNINNSSSGNRSLNALKLTKSLKCIFDAFIQDRFLAISRCLQDEEILNACIKLIVVTICFATNLPRAFFSEAGLVQSFFLFVSIIANACIEDRTETEHDTCTVSDLRTLRKREKTEELKEEEEEEEHKFPAQLSDFYSSVTHPLFRSYTLTQGGREHITRLVLIFMLFLKFFEKTLRMVFEENTKPLAFAINQIVKLIVRDEIVSFWDYEHTSRSSALHVVAKILPFKKFLDWVGVFFSSFGSSSFFVFFLFFKDLPVYFLRKEEVTLIFQISIFVVVYLCLYVYSSIDCGLSTHFSFHYFLFSFFFPYLIFSFFLFPLSFLTFLLHI